MSTPKRTQRKIKGLYRGTGPDNNDISSPRQGVNHVEDSMVNALDELNLFTSLRPILREALSERNPKKFLREVQVATLLGIYDIAQSAVSENARLNAWKDLADRAGLKPAEKQAILNLNTSDLTPREITAKIWELMDEGGDLEEAHQSTDKEASTRETGRTSKSARGTGGSQSEDKD